MIGYYSNFAEVILLDIEGTTTPVDYVFGVLFPFAQDHVAEFLTKHEQEREVQTDLEWLREEYENDLAQGLSAPDWKEIPVAYIQHLITIDRKSTALKSLQGKIWEEGYKDGRLRSQMFPDVKPAFTRWQSLGKLLFIFSSGSEKAQQLIFRYSEVGDMTSFIRGYFDTQIGSKREASSYQKIADAIKVAPEKILFISDVVAELVAAKTAGMQTLFSLRQGNHSSDGSGFTTIESFDGV